MGMLACYMTVDEPTLDSMMELDSEALSNRLIELEESKKFVTADLDKIWDALHCVLTGVPASTPIEGNKLSEAVVGVHNFIVDEDDADFISCIEHDELPEIIAALEKIDAAWLQANFDPKLLKQKEIDPNGIWEDSRGQLLKEMEDAISVLLAFYRQALATGHHVIVSIL